MRFPHQPEEELVEEEEEEEEEKAGGSVDVSAHGEVDESENVELDEDGEGQKDGVQDEAGQAQSPVQSPLVQMDAEDLNEEDTIRDTPHKDKKSGCNYETIPDLKELQCKAFIGLSGPPRNSRPAQVQLFTSGRVSVLGIWTSLHTYIHLTAFIRPSFLTICLFLKSIFLAYKIFGVNKI